jgi:excinuclease UvrABC nuclease subunit
MKLFNSQKWSTKFEFDREHIKNNIPIKSGVYVFLQKDFYRRYKGETRIIKIGKSSNLRQEIENHLIRHTCANRLKRIQKHNNQKIYFQFIEMNEEGIDDMEKILLKEFEDEYWDLPILNSQRGYARGEDIKFK